MLSKRISKYAPALATAVMAGLGASQALAALTIDMRVAGVTGTNTGFTAKSVSGVANGTTVTMQIWAQVTGSAGNSTPGLAQTLQSAGGSILSSNGGLLGNLSVPGGVTTGITAPFRANSSSAGFVTDLDGDGDLDVGSNNTGDAENFFSARSAKLLGPRSNDDGTTPGLVVNTIPGGWEYLLSLSRFVVTNNAGSTNVNFRPNQASFGAVWAENAAEQFNTDGDFSGYAGGQTFGPSNGTYTNGSAINIAGAAGTTPEPASLGLIGVAGLGLLARRRKA
jgi:hypothetical protein